MATVELESGETLADVTVRKKAENYIILSLPNGNRKSYSWNELTSVEESGLEILGRADERAVSEIVDRSENKEDAVARILSNGYFGESYTIEEVREVVGDMWESE